MTPDRLRECLGGLNWTTAALAAMAHVSPVTARRWLNGKVPIPADIARVIEQMAALAETLAHKPGWTRGQRNSL
jgi:transcriptional regulator with XRE-family HTH domain